MYQIFLLPHQDDELGIYAYIEQIKNKKKAIFIYLTTGKFNTSVNITRNFESQKVLENFGIPKKNIIFLGHITKTEDQRLCKKLEINLKKIKQLLHCKKINLISRIFTTAWEGGHPDHDAAFLLGLALSRFYKTNFFCFPLYSRINSSFFSLFSSNKAFYNEIKYKIRFTQIINFALNIFNYKSQFKTFLILFPIIIYKFLKNKNQKIFFLKKNFLLLKPHQGQLFYEKRFNISFKKFMYLTLQFRIQNLIFFAILYATTIAVAV